MAKITKFETFWAGGRLAGCVDLWKKEPFRNADGNFVDRGDAWLFDDVFLATFGFLPKTGECFRVDATVTKVK